MYSATSESCPRPTQETISVLHFVFQRRENSPLRREIIERTLDLNAFLEPLHYFTNDMWSNIISIVQVNGTNGFHEVHRNSDGGIDPHRLAHRSL